MRITAGDVVFVGPGKVDLLEAIDATRSITAAAKAMGMSYRRAWILVDEMNTSLAQPVVASATGGEAGGGSALTDAGRRLVELYRRIEAQAARAGAADIASLLRLIEAAPAGAAASRGPGRGRARR